jgi:alpha-amylase/alpha-mannosidase (GH57 family)
VSSVRSVVIHAHFYQPPRENPWTGVIERERSAAPDHDWNARITRECYAPLASIRVGRDEPDPPRLDAYNFLSYDVGPTLLPWLEREAPETYAAMLRGDRLSRERLGHGNAIAMPYHHVILPLCSRRDKETEVRWGIADFRRRFGREPVGLWLPETAVDEETLDVLAAEGIAFTVLAPHQVRRPPAHGLPGRVRTAGGRSIAVFLYDGPLSHGVAFASLLEDATRWEKELLADRSRRLVSIATDGETYGHHHRFADLALGALLYRLGSRRGIRVVNYAAALAAEAPREDVELVAPTSWSCAHGVERWRADCGCRMTPGGSKQQRWRKPLREAVDWLAQQVHARYERLGAALPGGPWAFRDAAGAAGPVAGTDEAGARLVEMERAALAAFTSCGWFFDDFAGLEGRQVLRYAARAIALADEEAPRLEAGLLERLAGAVSNDRKVGTAANFYMKKIKPERPA